MHKDILWYTEKNVYTGGNFPVSPLFIPNLT